MPIQMSAQKTVNALNAILDNPDCVDLDDKLWSRLTKEEIYLYK